MQRYKFSLIIITSLLIYLALSLKYNEDIREFLPLDKANNEAMSIYQNIAGANRLFILFKNTDDKDKTVSAIEAFLQDVNRLDSNKWCADITAQVDINKVNEVSDFVYNNIPYFLTSTDYERIDSLLSIPDYMDVQLNYNRQQLMLPTGGIFTQNLARDPLALFTPVMEAIRENSPHLSFELYDGYIFTPDLSRAIVMLTSPFGNSETEQNAELLALLDKAIKHTCENHPNVDIHVAGGPVVAVANSTQIKRDCIHCITIASILIFLLLIGSLQSLRNIFLIVLSIGWGWLFAIGGIALFRHDINIIVLGISSAIIGIAINYPLHLIVHTTHQPDVKKAIKEITMPLVVGNITTVGAFFALIPLQSSALRDLGIFASLLLVGTIIFVLYYLPKMIKVEQQTGVVVRALNRLANIQPESNRLVVWTTLIIAAILGFYSLNVEFDSNIANINYMTDSQRAEMDYFQKLLQKQNTSSQLDEMTTVYVFSSGQTADEALQMNIDTQIKIDTLKSLGFVVHHNSVSRFLTSSTEQKKRLLLWKEFVARHSELLTKGLNEAALSHGFSPIAFQPFFTLINDTSIQECQPTSYFQPLYENMFRQNIMLDKQTGNHFVVEPLLVSNNHLNEVKKRLPNSFDLLSLNCQLAK